MKVVNWNVQWATPAAARSPYILACLAEHSADIACLTETDRRLLSAWDGHTIESGPIPGQAATNNRRKVMLWSRKQWTDVDDFGHTALPPGRFIAGATEADGIPVSVIGVCIPYHNANVSVGRRDRAVWQEHESYLDGLASILSSRSKALLILLGDFNQQIGQRRRPYPLLSHPVRAQLQETMRATGPPGLTIVTAGLGLRGRRAIDHIAISGELSAVSLTTIDNRHGEQRLSDHFGVVAELSAHDAPQNPPQKSDRYDN